MKWSFNSFLALSAIAQVAKHVNGETYFQETFSDSSWKSRWVPSAWKEDMGEFALSSGLKWKVDENIEQGLRTTQDAKFYGISAKLDKPFSNKGHELVVQYSVKNEKENNWCAGGYIKLLPSTVDQKKFGGESPYYIMFGPDICGYDNSRIHLIFNHKGKNLLKTTDIKLDYDDKDDKTHLYTLVVRPDNTFSVYFDQKERSHGSLLEDWDFPQKMIPDPSDKKPADWIDDELMVDPEDEKPAGWDDIKPMISDPKATKPEDWDEEDDGAWEAPLVQNPAYKGEWKPKMIPNPKFKGKWAPKRLPNADFQEDVYAYDDIGALGFELWVVNSGSIFDNIYIGNSLEEANMLAEKTWKLISPKEAEVKKAWEKAHNKDAPSEHVTEENLDGHEEHVKEDL